MIGQERASDAKLEPVIGSKSATKLEPVAEPSSKSSSTSESNCESTNEPTIEPESIADSESIDEPESRANGCDDLGRAQKKGC